MWKSALHCSLQTETCQFISQSRVVPDFSQIALAVSTFQALNSSSE